MRYVASVVAGMIATAGMAGNLFPDGDFSQSRPGLSPHAFANGGRVALHTEDLTWNRCGHLFSPKVTTNAHGVVTAVACAIIGSDGTIPGVPVRGGATYDFSLEVRGNTGKVALGAWAWGRGIWEDGKKIKTTVSEWPVREKEWTTIRGSFTVPEQAVRAAVSVQIWGQSSADGPGPFDVEPEVFFDNVKIEEAVNCLVAPKHGSTHVRTIKSIAPGVEFSDFFGFDPVAGCARTSPADIRACVKLADESFLVGVSVSRDGGNRAGDMSTPWSGDCLEVHFGATGTGDAEREYTQFAWNAAGATFARTGNGRNVSGLELLKSRVSNGTWGSLARIPFAAIGLKKLPPPDVPLKFNIGFSGRGVGIASWSPISTGFADVGRFGNLYCGGYAAALKAKRGKGEAISGRADFEKRFAELETAEREAEFEQFRSGAFTVTTVSGETDWSMPFVPRESFSPVSNIHARAAINERMGIPVAVMNTTGADETYVVRLETSTFDPKRPYADLEYNGRWGLEGFPSAQITAREAVPIKDTESTPVTTRLDPLPKMNEACTIHVPACQAGLVWFDFDTKGVRSGTYLGRVRVIPLSQPSRFESCGGYGKGMYKGKMKDVPVELEVLPIVLPDMPSLPSGFFQKPLDESQFDLMSAVGAREFQVDPWCFAWFVGSDRRFDYSRPSASIAIEREKVRRVMEWSKARSFVPTFFVGFNSFPSFAGEKTFDEALRLWPDWVKGVKRCINEWGVDDAHYCIEVYDELNPKSFEEAKKVLSLAKAAEPSVRLALTMSANMLPVERMRELFDLVDSWTLWSSGNFSGKERIQFVRDARTAGKDVWHYTCSESARNSAYGWYRLHPWYGLRHDLTGNQFFLFQNPYGGYGSTDFKSGAGAGIVYSSFGSVMPSLRYMAMRTGVTDLKYLDALRALAGNQPEVKDFLAKAAIRVVETERHDRTAADRVRNEAIRLLLKHGGTR